MKRYVYLIVLVLFALPALALAQTPVEDFSKANGAYRSGKYLDAIAGYEAILNSGTHSGAIYYNLANSYFKNKQLGKAILNYERAQRLIPRDRDLAANYQFASAAVNARVDPVLNVTDKILSGHVHFYTVNEMVLILAIFACLLGLAHLMGLYFKWTGKVWAIAFLCGLFFTFIFGLLIKVNLQKKESIVIKAVAARFEPSDKATVYFELPQGQKVRWQTTEGSWVKVQRPDGKIGWMPIDAVEKI